MEVLDIKPAREFNGYMLQHIEIQRHYPEKIRLVQLTDMHISADENELFGGVNTTGTLLDVIADVKRQEDLDLVLLTGDLANTPSVETYEKLAALLQQVNAPVHCLPGNHDDPQLMQRCLNTGNVSTANFLSCGAWSIILLNTFMAGDHGGYLSTAELSCLETALARSYDKHILICLHHPPVNIHSAWLDAMALKNSEALFQALDRHDNVRGIIWGHIHQEFSTTRNGVLLFGSPSTCVQFLQQSDEVGIDTKPPAYRSLTLTENGAIQTRIHWL